MKNPSLKYYISANGNDGNIGLGEQTPWQSIDKVNSTKLNPSDQILFRSGEIFPGELIL